MKSKYTLTTICFTFLVSLIFAQTVYSPLNTLPEDLEFLESKYKNTVQTDISQLDASSKDSKEAMVEYYEKRTTRILNNINNQHYIFNEEINDYFNEILKEIVSKNEKLQGQEIKLMVSRYPWPNATCLGEGTIVFNIGLIRRLENEAQVAFIICHELAHYYLDHVNNNIHSHCEHIHSKAFQKEISKIKRNEYNQYEKASELLKGLVYDDRRHSRTHEGEADSMGYVLMKNTKYDVTQALSALQILDEIDGEKYTSPLEIDQKFSFENYPFRERWLEKEGGMLYQKTADAQDDDTAWEKDSLKTHPDCQKRIKALGSLMGMEDFEGKKDVAFEKFVLLSDFEIIQSEYDFGSWGRCLFHALQLEKEYPEDLYLKKMIGQCMVRICKAQYNHEIAKYVGKPNPRNDEEYNIVLNFLQNLRARELSLISYHYFQGIATEENLKDEGFLFHALLAAKYAKKEEELADYKSRYISNFHKKGIYAKEFENLD